MVALNQIREKCFSELKVEEQIILGEHSLKLNQKEREIILEPSLERYLEQSLPHINELRNKRIALQQQVEAVKKQYLEQKKWLSAQIQKAKGKLEVREELLQWAEEGEKMHRCFMLSVVATLGGGLGGLIGYVFSLNSTIAEEQEKKTGVPTYVLGMSMGAAVAGLSAYREAQHYTKPALEPYVHAVKSCEADLQEKSIDLQRFERKIGQKSIEKAKQVLQEFESNIEESRDYRLWALKTYKIAIPILAQFLKTVEEKEKIEKMCECPISLDWMAYPVQANDGYYYEHDVILKYIMQRTQEGRNLDSPMRIGILKPDSLYYEADYYKKMLTSLKENYNSRVKEQYARYRRNQYEKKSDPAFVYYNDSQRRIEIINRMMSKVVALDIPIQERVKYLEDLNACKELPKPVPLT